MNQLPNAFARIQTAPFGVELPVSRALLSTPFFKAATSERLADRAGVPHAEFATFYRKVAKNQQLSLIITGHIAVSAEAKAESRQIFLAQRDLHHSTLRVRNLRRTVRAVKQEVLSDDDLVNYRQESGDLNKEQNRNAWLPVEQRAGANRDFILNNNPRLGQNNKFQQPGVAANRPLFIAQISHAGPQIPRYLHPKQRFGYTPTRNAFCMFSADLSPPPRFVINQFVEAAEICIKCGFDGVQVHAAHGWLLDDCLRAGNDAFVMEVVQSVREAIGNEKILAIKLNAERRNLQFIKSVQHLIDFVEVSAGSYNDPMKMVDNHRTRYAAEFAEELARENLSCKIAATGGFYNISEGQTAIELGQCEMAGFGRLFCLPEPTQVVRLSEKGVTGRLMLWLGRRVPLCNAGPAVVWYQEVIRKVGLNKVKTNKQCQHRLQFLWYMFTLLSYFFGCVMHATRAEWSK